MEKKLYNVKLKIEATSQQEANLKLERMVSKLAEIKRDEEVSWKAIFIQIGLGAAQYYLDHREKPKTTFHQQSFK